MEVVIIVGVVTALIAVFMTWYIKHNAKEVNNQECQKDGAEWRRLMTRFYTSERDAAECLSKALVLEKKWSHNPEIPLAWRDAELVKLIDKFNANTKTPDTTQPTTDTDEFNMKGAIIGGTLGGITGAYIGSHIKKKDDE